MIYLINKRKLNIHSKQSGVTLLLAILVLSSVLAISFSLATITFIEVRSSNDLLKSEGSLFGASAIAEEAIFSIKRQVPLCPTGYPNCLSFPTQLTNSVSFPDQPVYTSISNPVVQVKVPKNTSFDNTKIKYDFCGSVASTAGCGYGKVKIIFNDVGSGGSVYAYLCEFDPNANYDSAPCSDPGNSSYFANHSQLSAVTNSSVEWSLDLNKQQQLILYNVSTNSDAYVSVTTYDTDRTTLKGLPYVGETAVEINSASGQLSRKVRVIVPNLGNVSAGAPGSTDTVWVEDDIPAGGSCGADAPDVCPWNKVSSNPSQYAGSYAFQSGIYVGLHQMYFDNAASQLAISTGDTMFAYVYIDPGNLPNEIMLQWNSTTQGWNHRAYWGADNIPWGVNGTQSRYNVSGSIPASGQWIRLSVPASAVGLEGLTLKGMAFTLYGGRATWDHAGKSQ